MFASQGFSDLEHAGWHFRTQTRRASKPSFMGKEVPVAPRTILCDCVALQVGELREPLPVTMYGENFLELECAQLPVSRDSSCDFPLLIRNCAARCRDWHGTEIRLRRFAETLGRCRQSDRGEVQAGAAVGIRISLFLIFLPYAPGGAARQITEGSRQCTNLGLPHQSHPLSARCDTGGI